jgi:thiol:disulfide interchange protein
MMVLMAGCSVLSAADKVYDSHRDPTKDLADAKAQATAEHKNILVDVGGNWCPWCIRLDRQLNTEPYRRLMLKGFIVVHVNVGFYFHKNSKFLKQFPLVSDYPHLFVLGPDGTMLKNVDLKTDLASDDPTKQEAKTIDFLVRWTPAPVSTH